MTKDATRTENSGAFLLKPSLTAPLSRPAITDSRITTPAVTAIIVTLVFSPQQLSPDRNRTSKNNGEATTNPIEKMIGARYVFSLDMVA